MKYHVKLSLQVTIIQADQEGFQAEADLSIILIPPYMLSLLNQKISCVA